VPFVCHLLALGLPLRGISTPVYALQFRCVSTLCFAIAMHCPAMQCPCCVLSARGILVWKGDVKMTSLQSEIQSFKNRYSVHGDEPVTKTELAEFARRLADLLNELAK
jgi:hypothetical protein